MGSKETATATTGGPRVIDVFDGNGAPSGPNYLLFSGVDRLSGSLWVRSGSGSRLCRIRHRCGSLELPEGSESKPWPIAAKVARTAERIRPKMIEAAAYAA